MRHWITILAGLAAFGLWPRPAAAQDLTDVLEQVGALMDDAVLNLHRSSRRPKPEKPAEHVDKAIESQREVLEILDKLIEGVEKAPG